MAASYDARWVSVRGAEPRKWWVRIKAKVDTGAKRCSIDAGLAEALGLEQIGSVSVRNAMGQQERPLVTAQVRIGRTTHDIEMTVADRSQLKCPMLLGKMFLDRVELQQPNLPKSKDFPQFV